MGFSSSAPESSESSDAVAAASKSPGDGTYMRALDGSTQTKENSVSKHRQSELTVKQNMELCREEMELYIYVFPTKDTVKNMGSCC